MKGDLNKFWTDRKSNVDKLQASERGMKIYKNN